eukprot:COSAG01_NODE_430_length_17153_cov_24.866717_17_plen_96_part_00
MCSMAPCPQQTRVCGHNWCVVTIDAVQDPAPPPLAYRGPRPAWPLTDEGVQAMIDAFRSAPDQPLYQNFAVAILARVKKQLEVGGASAPYPPFFA